VSQPAVTREFIDRSELLQRVATLPRVRFASLPTPLEEAPRLRQALGPDAPRILIKRDDLTGLALGGNKVRHLEFRMGDIQAKGADTLIVTNVAQSNHARLHTALAARFGLTNYIIKIPSQKDDPVNGNLLLGHIMGAKIVEAPSADPEAITAELDRLIEKLEAEGHTVYDVPRDRFSKIAGTCGYLAGAVELLDQLDELGAQADHIFMAHGTSSAGLTLAGKLLGQRYRVHPVSVGPDQAGVEEYVCASANGVAELLGFDTRITPDDFSAHGEYVGERYGIPTGAGLEAMRLAGRTEALILDPVYTSKAMSALIDHVRRGAIGPEETVVFVHTGGLPITFAYADEIMASLREVVD
jgi:1-aminocyclopropane-1-carboxylate deaminase/D-cysteine desulfhydrase-like pyridoxal-dependent ACC family enzyme